MGACYGRLATNGRGQPEEVVRPQRDPGVKTQPLKKDVIKWKSENPITMGQLNSKRDEFWETAPMFEGRREIWDAIKGAVNAIENSDYPMAQAILDGANIFIPHGTLMEAYDELGNQYKVPLYCLSRPVNILCEDFDENSPIEEFTNDEAAEEDKHWIKLRLSSSGKDVDLPVRRAESVSSCKAKLGVKISTNLRQRWFYGGKLVEDKTKVRDLGVPDGHIIQVVFLEHGLFTNTNGTLPTPSTQ
ncbi:ubiquitin domain-containing protein 1 [Folsomia candida]|uniref:ubiquitin domain-containing protein 1 n=1 Tax=Folsomia candida TaxID=158441 RepID=UPI000B8F4035|nr:ubiquitin domain-containing protein 1 [Folsomia candida]XP_021966855.1 ubiquitin domain-containing protein 1 [Folsomia candida]